jgi:hypothetical protein
MATTVYFEKTIKDADPKSDETLHLELGTSSFLGPKKLYIRAGDIAVLVDDGTAKEFFEAVQNAGRYLNLL